jgi:hypothetical protein
VDGVRAAYKIWVRGRAGSQSTRAGAHRRTE